MFLREALNKLSQIVNLSLTLGLLLKNQRLDYIYPRQRFPPNVKAPENSPCVISFSGLCISASLTSQRSSPPTCQPYVYMPSKHLAFLPSDSPIRKRAVHETSSKILTGVPVWFWWSQIRKLYGATLLSESGENAGRLGSALEALDLAGVGSQKKQAAAFSRQLRALNLEIPVYPKPEGGRYFLGRTVQSSKQTRSDDPVLLWTRILVDSSQASNSSLGSLHVDPLVLAGPDSLRDLPAGHHFIIPEGNTFQVLSSPEVLAPLPVGSWPAPSSSDDASQASNSEQGSLPPGWEPLAVSDDNAFDFPAWVPRERAAREQGVVAESDGLPSPSNRPRSPSDGLPSISAVGMISVDATAETPAATAHPVLLTDVLAWDEHLPQGGTLISFHTPTSVAEWLATGAQDKFFALAELPPNGMAGPFPYQLSPTEEALLLFALPSDSLVSAMHAVADATGFPVILRPPTENPLAHTGLTRMERLRGGGSRSDSSLSSTTHEILRKTAELVKRKGKGKGRDTEGSITIPRADDNAGKLKHHIASIELALKDGEDNIEVNPVRLYMKFEARFLFGVQMYRPYQGKPPCGTYPEVSETLQNSAELPAIK
ncbi:hypothetical protein C8F01DRAFT_1253045 [Mycena amicta]|nr:hypothetical protein C8F01DRAFT_1253045 [Mycena amicta]